MGNASRTVSTLGPVQLSGQLGWDMVAAIPRTVGIALSNRTLGTNLQTYGAGIGGNVVGVHVFLRKELKDPLTPEDSNDLKRAIESIPASLVATSGVLRSALRGS